MESGSKRRYSLSRPAAKQKIEKILSELSEKLLCMNDLKKVANVTHSHIKVYVRHLLETRQIYISKWKLETQGSRTMHWPYYRAGNRKNAVKPPPLTRSEKDKRYRSKLYSDKERLDKVNAKRRAKRIKPKTDWTTSWIMNSSSGQKKTE